MPLHGDCLFVDPHSSHTFYNEVKLLHPRVLVESHGALGGEPPEPRTQNFALGPLQKIRIGDFHHIGWSPREVFWLNYKVGLNRDYGWRCHHLLTAPKISARRLSRPVIRA